MAGAAGDTPPDEPIKLPSVTVAGELELPKPESWLYARIEGFEILSNASDKATQSLVKDFVRFRKAADIVQPTPPPQYRASALIICGKNKSFENFTPSGKSDQDGGVSLLLHDNEQAAIVIDYSRRTVDYTSPTGSDFDAESPALESGASYIHHERHLYGEYIRYHFSRSPLKTNAWLTEGLALMFENIEFSDERIKFGNLEPSGFGTGGVETPMPKLDIITPGTTGPGQFVPSGTSAAAGMVAPEGTAVYLPFNTVLHHRPLMPMDAFLAITADAKEVRQPFVNCEWLMQAYAFVHMCEFGLDGRFKKPFVAYVKRLSSEPPTEKLFRECFGLSYAEIFKELRRYIVYPRYKFRNISLTKEGRLPSADIEFRAATQGEIGRIVGDAQTLAGRPADALFTYRVAYARGERDSNLLASLGLAELGAGDTARARRFLEEAARLKTDRAPAYLALTKLRLAEALTRTPPGGKLPAEQTALVLSPLLKARSLKPVPPETYSLLAQAWELSAVPPTTGNVNLVGEGVLQNPSDTLLALRTARLYQRASDKTNAIAVARMALKFTNDSALKSQLEQLLATLERHAPASAP